MDETIQQSRSICALLVGLDEDQVTLCKDALVPLRAAECLDALAASDRIPVDRPFLVIVPPDFADIEIELLHDSAVAVGAEVFKLPSKITTRELARELRETLRSAEQRRAKNG